MRGAAGRPAVRVVAGVLMREDGRVLLARRPDTKPSGGHWEFPGGKIDAGEKPARALARELEEETGVAVTAARPWLSYDHAYPDKLVRLQVYRVTGWRGTPHGRERQPISWEDPAALAVAPMMAAHLRALAALRLPEVLGLADAGHQPCPAALVAQAAQALAGGIGLVVLRARGLVPAQAGQIARRLAALCERHGARLHVDAPGLPAVAVAQAGRHRAGDDLARIPPPPPGRPWSADCRDAGQLALAAAQGAAFALVRVPVLEDHAGHDWAAFAATVRASALPVYACGPVGAADLDAAQAAGAHGIALPLAQPRNRSVPGR